MSRRGRILVTALAYLACTIAQIERLQYRTVARSLGSLASEKFLFLSIMAALFLGLVLIFLQLLVEAILAERQSREKLAIANARLRDYALRVEDIAMLQERNRIAREIHDSLGHSLTIFNLHLEAALRLLDSDPEEATELLKEAKQLGATALQDVRQSVATLRADPLKGRTLEDAIATLAEDCQRSAGIVPQRDIAIAHSIAETYKTATYRIIQEALTNICKYARATEVKIVARTTNTQLHIEIADNGQGFNLAQTSTGFGLQGMKERTRALGGTLKIITSPGRGCTILAQFPLAAIAKE